MVVFAVPVAVAVSVVFLVALSLARSAGAADDVGSARVTVCAAADGALIDAGLLTILSTRQVEEHVMTIYGRLDLHSTEALRDELRRVERTNADRIIIDLSHLQFVDAAGISTILHAQARSRRGGERLVFIRARETVDRALRLTGADRLLPYVD
jgi:anti-anti-sigma factor